MLGLGKSYKDIRHLYEGHTYSQDIWDHFSGKINYRDEEFYNVSIKVLANKFHNDPCANRTIPYANFYNTELKSIIRKVYAVDFDFYESKTGQSYDL